MRGLVCSTAGAGAVFMAAFWISLFVKGGVDLTALVLGVALVLIAAGILLADRRKARVKR